MNNDKQIKFNLSSFLERLSTALYEGHEEREESELGVNEIEGVDDIIQEYRGFISRTREPLLTSVKSYVGNHYLVSGNEKVTSFIESCYR